MKRFLWWTFLEIFLVVLLHLCSMLVAGAVLFHIVRNPSLTFSLLSLLAVLPLSVSLFKSKTGKGTKHNAPDGPDNPEPPIPE